jgi:hypothetical protein
MATSARPAAEAARTTRLVVGPAALDPDGQREEISAFPDRLKLG